MSIFSSIIKGAINAVENKDELKNFVGKAAELKQDVSQHLQKREAEHIIKTCKEISDSISNMEQSLDLNMKISKGKFYEQSILIDESSLLQWKYSVPCKYDMVKRISLQYYAAVINNKYGIIDAKDNIIIPFKYEWIGSMSHEILPVKLNGKYGYINIKDETVISFKFDDAGTFCNKLAPVGTIVNNKIKYGYIDALGDYIIEPEYDYANEFCENGLACAEKYDYSGNERKKGVIDSRGKIIVNMRFSDIEIETDYIMYKLEEFHSPKYFDLNGNPLEMDEPKIAVVKNAIIPYNNSDLVYGYYMSTSDGDHCKIKPMFKEVHDFSDDGFAVVNRDNMYGIIEIDEV